MTGKLAGKVALVTGASRGLGRGTARLFAREGAAVVVNYAAREDLAQEVVDAICSSGGQAMAIRADVARRSDVAAMVSAAVDRFGKLDILINNAGIWYGGTTLTVDSQQLDELMSVNVKGCINCIQEVAPGMMERRYGKIVNFSSAAGLGTMAPENTPYALTKAAVIALTKRAALELSPHGINVNVICPGLIRTEMGTAPTADRTVSGIVGRTLLGRIGEVDDVAAAALFLASDDSSYITAQILAVDGGRTDFLSHGG
jgi:3-oxoacyl-[acyl-carrier protein] reductase